MASTPDKLQRRRAGRIQILEFTKENGGGLPASLEHMVDKIASNERMKWIDARDLLIMRLKMGIE